MPPFYSINKGPTSWRHGSTHPVGEWVTVPVEMKKVEVVMGSSSPGPPRSPTPPSRPPPPPPLASGCEDHWSWNKNDKSHEVHLYGPKQRIAHFHPNWSHSTAGVRGTRVLNGGRYYWEVNVSQRIFGTSMMFGVGTRRARLHVDAFVNMLGEEEASWGLSHKGLLWHAGHSKTYIKPFRENVATTIGIYFDGISGNLTFYKDGQCLGVAFAGLQDVTEPLYPIVCSTAAKTEMALGVLKRDFLSLQDRCRATVLAHLTHEEQIDRLKLPLRIKHFISEGLENFQENDGASVEHLVEYLDI